MPKHRPPGVAHSAQSHCDLSSSGGATLTGFTPPFTPRGLASLVSPPLWHYAGWLINIEFECDRDRAAEFVPTALGTATGRGTVHFADWQSTTDGTELLDPVLSQYRETIVLLEIIRPDGTAANFCPLIYPTFRTSRT
jgi:hypothetical protein